MDDVKLQVVQQDPVAPGRDTSDAGDKGQVRPTAATARRARDSAQRARDAEAAKRRRSARKAAQVQQDAKTEKILASAADPAATTAATSPVDPEVYRPLAYQLWGMIGAALERTRWRLSCPEAELIKVKLGAEEINLPPKIQTLGDATAPLVAKYLPDELATPEAQFIFALLIVFGPPTAEYFAGVPDRSPPVATAPAEPEQRAAPSP